MSLRCYGNQVLQSASSSLFSGASTASLSLWISVGSDSSIANPGGVLLFGVGGKVAVSLFGANQLQVSWTSNNGTVNGGSSYVQALLPGINYHLAAIWQGGYQQYFLNGILIGSDSQPGVLGILGDHSAQPVVLGSNSPGVDLTLDELTLWVNYALTAQDAKNLRDRVVHPEGIAPASIAAQYSLAGPDGQTVKIGDAGISDASTSGLNLTSITGTAPAYQGGVLSYSLPDQGCLATVAPSGQSIIFTFHDEAYNPVNVNVLAADNEIQNLLVSGPAAGGSFTLSLNNETTASIPIISNPPLTNFQWNATLAGPGTYDLSVNLFYNSGHSAAVLYQVFDGTNQVGSITLDAADQNNNNPPSFQDGTLCQDGSAVNWMPLGRFSFAGSQATVQVSCNGSATAGQTIYIDFLRIATTDGATVQKVGPDVPPAVEYGGPWRSYPTNHDVANATIHTEAFGQGTQNYFTVDPNVIKSAIEALPGVGAGNTIVSGNGTGSNPLVVQFVGALAGVRIPIMTSSDPAVTVTRVLAGGSWPQISINGAAPIRLSNPYYGSGYGNGLSNPRTSNPYLPSIIFPLIQSAPPVRYEAMGTYLNTSSNGNGAYWSPSGLSGYSANPLVSNGVGASATWVEQGLPGGQYRLSVTWSTQSNNSTDVIYTVTDRYGTVQGTYHVDQSKTPDAPVDQNVPWHVLGTFTVPGLVEDLAITLTNNTSGPMMADAARFELVSPNTSISIKPTDQVTYSALAGWLSTVQGPAPAVSNGTVVNQVGGTIYPTFVGSTKTMPVGWNINTTHGNAALITYANIAHQIEGPIGLTFDGNGYPLTLSSSSTSVQIAYGPPSIMGNGRPWTSIPPGNYTFMWDGACNLTADGTEDVSQQSITGTTDNKRVYATGYGIVVKIFGTTPVGDGTWNCDLKNLRVYPPGVDPANPPKFHPEYLSKIQAARSLRFLDPIGAITGNGTEFADYNKPQSILSRFSPTRYSQAPIAEIRNYSGSDHFWDPSRGVILQVTTSVPHGFSEGQIFGTPNDPGTAQLSNGTQFPLQNSGFVHVISPTVFNYSVGPSGGVTMTNVVTNTGAVSVLAGNGMPIQDMVDLCNAVGADFYMNTNIACTDDCLTALGTFVAQNLNPGLKLRVEFSNEIWNYYSPPYTYCSSATYGLGLGDKSSSDYMPFYLTRAAHHWSLIGAAMAAQGRGGDMIRVVGSQHSYIGITQGLATYASQNGIVFDELAVAPYIENAPSFLSGASSEPSFNPIIDVMTPDQLIDLFEIFTTYSGFNKEIPAHRGALNAQGLQKVRIITYEGGPENMIPYAGGPPSKIGQKAHAIHRHPRFCNFMLHYFQVFQDSGLTLYQLYYLNGNDGGATGPFPMWSAYCCTGQPPGTGDPTIDQANLLTPDETDLIKSEVGGAFNRWSSLVYKAPIPTAPTTGSGFASPVNGKTLAIGLPRGVHRTTR